MTSLTREQRLQFQAHLLVCYCAQGNIKLHLGAHFSRPCDEVGIPFVARWVNDRNCGYFYLSDVMG